MRLTDRLAATQHHLAYVLERITTGRADQPTTLTRLEHALERCEQWTRTTTPSTGPARGGTTTIRETEERRADHHLHQDATLALTRIPELARTIHRATRELERLVRWAAETRATEQPDTTPIPGCSSCARLGHFNPIRIAAWGLCDLCYRYALANMHTRGAEAIERTDWPPTRYIDIAARQSPQAAGRWLARQTNRHAS